ncbi:DUF1516 family protein [Camelliibacillus cellulosilyticus]|uniref:DUF1516 family protein n=1 Tax=Camelliibacillus cellulosilyticus TaxID=2174486 RepID=A0ABV9GNU6_9BACL
MLHAHVGFWTLAIILFIVSYILVKTGSGKAQKVVHMILRLVYLCVFITGIIMVVQFYGGGSYGWPTVKGLFGLLVLAMMEMVLVKANKKQNTIVYWILLIIGLIAVFYIGYGVLG